MPHYRVIISVIKVFGFQIVPSSVFSHAGLLLEDEVFDYGPGGYNRRNKEECNNFHFEIGGLPEGHTIVWPDDLHNMVIDDGSWTRNNYHLLNHNCHDFVEFCLMKIGQPVKKEWFIYIPKGEENVLKGALKFFGKNPDEYALGFSNIYRLWKTGGVEFIFPRIIPHFTKHFCFSNVHYIGFKFHENNFDIQSRMLNLVNEKFLINNIKINSMDELFSTILNELAIGFLFNKKLPYVSLSFNKKKLIYSIQNDFYKHTLVGNIITMLDFYLKSYVNGGFFKEEFIYEWYKTKNTDKEYLESNLILLHKYLLDFYKDITKYEYYIFEEFLKEEKYQSGTDYLIAFRIVGKISKTLDIYKEILIPDCHFESQADFTPFPILYDKAKEKQDIEKAVEKMRKLVFFHMEKVPYFQPYFELLRIITFCIHYLPNIQECGLFPDFSNSIQNKYPGIKYVKNVPPVFPQLPTRKLIKINVDIYFNDIIQLMTNEQINYINKIITYNYLEKQDKNNDYLSISEKIDRAIEEIFKIKIKEKLGKENEYLIAYYHLRKNGLDSIKNMFIKNVNKIVIKDIFKSYFSLFKIINENKDIFEANLDNHNFEKIFSLKTLKDIEEFINTFVSIIYTTLDNSEGKFKENLKRFEEKIRISGKEMIEKEINKIIFHERKLLFEKYKNNLKVDEIMNSEKNKKIIAEQKLKIKKNIENQIIEKIENKKKKEKELKLLIENKINELSNEFFVLSNKINNSTIINKSDKYENNTYIHFELNIPKITYGSKINLDDVNQNFIGGCVFKLNHKIKLNKIIIDDNSYQAIKKNKIPNYNFHNKYYIIKSKLKQGFAFDDLNFFNAMKALDKGQENIISELKARNYNPSDNIKDYSGASKTHYKMLLKNVNEQNLISENELNIKDQNEYRLEIYAICTNNTKMIEKLFKMKNSDFSSNICDVVSPFLFAIMTKNKEMINIFLNNCQRLGDLNYSSEVKNTPLHYLCLLNMPEESYNLLQKVDRLDLVDEREGNNPLQLLCINSNFETLKKILNYKKINEYINIKRFDGKSLLHFTSQNSILCTSLLLRKNIDKYTKDKNNISPLENAFFSGRYDCFNKINGNNNNSLFNELNKNLNDFLKNLKRKDIIDKEIKIISKDSLISEIKSLFKIGNINRITQIIEYDKKYKLNYIPFTDYKSCKKIANCACKIGNVNFIEILLKLVNYKIFPIAPFVGKYGLIKWVNELVKYGIDLFQSNKNILGGKTIFDLCVKSNNSKLYKLIFKYIETPNEFIQNIIANNFVEALFYDKKRIIYEIVNQFEKPKFRNIKLSIQKLSTSVKTTSKMLSNCLKLNFIDPKSLDIFSAVKYCRPSVVRLILSLESNKINKEKLKELISNITKFNRLDNLMVLHEKFNINEIYPNSININFITEKLVEIESISETPRTLAENALIQRMKKINKKFNIGLMELPFSNTFLLHSFFKNNNFWIFDCLNEPFKSDIFIKDEKGLTPFDYISLFDDDFINFDLEKIINFFNLQKINEKEKAKNILNSINQLNNIIIRDKFEDKYISKVFNIINKLSNIYSYKNDDGDNILHILTKIKNINLMTIKEIISNLNNIKAKNLKFFRKIINSQNNRGETPIMNIFESSNIYYIEAIINQFKDDINFYLFNIENNNLLHLLFLNFKWEEQKYDENKIIYNILLNIFSKTTDIILHQNIKFKNPCILAAGSGSNISLFLMHCLHSKEAIEKFNLGENELCLACQSNNVNTVRYLIEYLNLDINHQIKYDSTNFDLYKSIFDDEFIYPELSTPLHICGYNSSLQVLEYLINNGANPFLLDEYNNDAISICLKYANEETLSYLFSTKIIDINNDNDKYLLSLVKNVNANKYFEPILYRNGYDNLFIVDENINNLIMLSCLYKNPEITRKLLKNDYDLLAKNKYGLNLLHICCYKNSYSCAGIILDYLYYSNQTNIIYDLIYSKNNDGETPLHIVAEKNYFSLTILFLSYFLKNNKQVELIKNNRNLNPIQLSIFKHNFEITLIFIKFLNKNILELINDVKIDSIESEFNSFLYFQDSGYYKELINEINNKYDSIQYFEKNNEEKIFMKKEYISKENIKSKESYFINIKNNIYPKMKERLNKKLVNNNFSEDLYYKYKSLFLGQDLILFLEKSNQNEIRRILDIFYLIPYDNKIIMNFAKIYINCFIIDSNRENINLILDEMIELIQFLNKNEDYLNIPITNFLTQIIISAVESYKKENIKNIIQNIKTFRNFLISNRKDYMPLVKNLISYIKSFKYLKQINIIMNAIINPDIKKIQFKYSYMIPPLLTKEIIPLLQNYTIITKYIFSSLNIHDFIRNYLTKKEISPKLLDIIIELNEKIINNEELFYDEKLFLFELLDRFIKFNKLSTGDLCNKLQSFTDLSILFLTKKKNLSEFKNIIKENNFIFENILFELNSYNTLKTFNFNEYEQNLENILNGIELLSNQEKNNLKEFSFSLKKNYIEMEMVKDFKKKGKILGSEFRNKPTIENSAKLIAIIMKAVEETMNVSPYLIQCISIESFLFHYKDYNERKEKKGRLAQIKTGEGKSLIIAMLSLANALMGFFVDVFTLSKYLAKRDQIKYKKLFDLFGISSNNITKQHPNKDDYNAIILYGTNTDFEFSLLRENIFIENKIFTKPLNSNVTIKRSYNVAIVDECDNLFLDTALNSARISHKNKNISLNWVYAPIFQFVSEGNNNVNSLRDVLIKYEKGIHKNIVSSLPDKKLQRWIISAKVAIKKKKNLDYIVAFNKDLQKEEVQIVSKDTGRIQIGSRWTAGIHEFIEVKEHLTPENESNIIGSISHPTYFENYDTIFGLTGTIGEDIERNEIMEIYKLDSYYIPRNFKEQIKKLDTEIFESKDLKFQRIIEIIGKYILQPKLVILPDIDNTLEFSALLNSLGIAHMVLNDAQKENEDYILDKSGEKSNILIATNAAGRGTDIILSEESKKLGGLLVIFGFFPENSRIENQGIGRAGRQGNPGMNKIIFSKDELFIKILGADKINNNNIDSYYNLRNNYIHQISELRISYVKNERKYFDCLKMFFSFKAFLDNILKNDYFLNKIDSKNIHNINLYYYIKNAIIFVEDSWSEFYSEISSERNVEDEVNKNSFFNEYLFVLNEKWSKYCIKLYKNNIDIYKEDLFHNILTDIINQWIEKSSEQNELLSTNFEKFIRDFKLQN